MFCDKKKEISGRIITPQERSFTLVFVIRRMAGGSDPFLPEIEILCQADPI